MCFFFLPQSITPMFDFSAWTLWFIGKEEMLLQVIYPNYESIYHLFTLKLFPSHVIKSEYWHIQTLETDSSYIT